MSLLEELSELERDKNSHRRGKKFETFLAHMLEEEAFKVTRDPGTASPRQTDLFARNEQVSFLVDAKWTRRKTGLQEICEVRDRLRRVPRDIFACVFSIAGFSEGAM